MVIIMTFSGCATQLLYAVLMYTTCVGMSVTVVVYQLSTISYWWHTIDTYNNTQLL